MATVLKKAIFGDKKTDTELNVIPTKRLAGNKIYTFCAMMAYNLSGEIQMLASNTGLSALLKHHWH